MIGGDERETRLNGAIFSATSCSFQLANAPFVGITSLNYSQKLDSKAVYGNNKSRPPIGFSTGKYSCDVGMTMLRSSYQRLIEILAGPLSSGFGVFYSSPKKIGSYANAKFSIIAQFSEPTMTLQGMLPITIDITGAQIVGEKDAYQEGYDELVTEVDLTAYSLTRNGLVLYTSA